MLSWYLYRVCTSGNGLRSRIRAISHVFSSRTSLASDTLWCYGCTTDSPPTPQHCQVPSPHHWKGQRRKDLDSPASLRYHRKSGDLQESSIEHSRAGAFSILVVALSISSSSQVQLDPSMEVRRAYFLLLSVAGRDDLPYAARRTRHRGRIVFHKSCRLCFPRLPWIRIRRRNGGENRARFCPS
jgi:hypothetical protein